MSIVKTTKVKNIALDRVAIQDKFKVYQISYRGLEKSERRTSYKNIVRSLYGTGKVLSLVQNWKFSCYLVLLPANSSCQLDDQRLAITEVPIDGASNLPDWQLARLLIKAMPHLIKGDDVSSGMSRFEAEGLFYVVKAVKTPKKGIKETTLVTLEVDLQPCLLNQGQRLALGVKTFTPVSYHTAPDGALYRDVQNSTRYSFDQWAQLVAKSAKGDYIKRSFRGGRKNTVAMVDVTSDSYMNFQMSKLGILAQFIDDLQSCYEGALEIEFDEIESSVREEWRNATKSVEQCYNKIFEHLRQFPIALIDYGKNRKASVLFESYLLREGFVVEHTNIPTEGGLNLLLVENVDSYETDEDDPYKRIKRQHPNAVIQSSEAENLILLKKGETLLNRSVAEVLLKELFIKHEVQSRRFLLSDYQPPEGWIFGLPEVNWKDRSYKLNVMKVCNELLEFDTYNELESDDLLLDFGEHKHLIDDKSAPFLLDEASGDYYIFMDTGVVALPEFEALSETLKEIHHCRSKGIEKYWILEFIEQVAPNIDKAGILVDQLQTVLAANQNEKSIAWSDLSQVHNKGAGKHFYEWLMSEKGFKLKDSLRSWDSGHFEATQGFFYNAESKQYYVGAIGSVRSSIPKFCQIRQIVTNREDVPKKVLDLLSALHIRHRQLTVMPYPFKHLREYVARQALAEKLGSEI
ncbi:hypothetical protein [Alkalimarinus alittae]|uniref:Uncharacterized protein n=1 Tax=Alkalimarinus alittae TaxID=2961619 RepID=A0ABY6MX77_9ALTE|nr:hypothetical protein [Alkalimarinus alittae]UZE94443.1 hypothetical protein NKI27_10090 [Alkalimarinus alittae]